VRSGIFFAIYFLYLMTVVGLIQRLLLWPAILLWPARRRALIRAWIRAHAHATFAMMRALANVRVTVRGAIAPTSCVVVMNHQSVLDIPLGLMLTPGPLPVIVTRDRYRYGIPGVSPLGRMARFPYVTQRRDATRGDLTALAEAADQVARGEQSLIIFPEGHRTRDGRIGHFMRNGLRLILKRAGRPVYCVVADGMWHARTFADALVNFADTNVRVVILGPFPPPDPDSVDSFIDSLRERMTAALDQLRSSSVSQATGAAHPIAAR
jgi:1-acyl-sn-glycerol-3-phosphate acyltransferase